MPNGEKEVGPMNFGSRECACIDVVGQALDLNRFLECEINMQCIVVVGNRSSRVIAGVFVTPRGYAV